MRQADAGVALDAEQEAMASQGLKPMVRVGRPLLDYILSGLADIGARSVCLVIGPEHVAIREYYRDAVPLSRLTLSFAIQERPLGTADAMLAAESFAAGESVLALNGDNYYPASGLTALAALSRAGLIGFRQSGLLADGSIPAERVRAFALIAADGEGNLTRIVEKPTADQAATFGPDPLVSMNAWLLPPSIYDACRSVTPSSRGELELQDAIRISMDRHGERYQVVESSQAVLDLSGRSDIPGVTARLRDVTVRL